MIQVLELHVCDYIQSRNMLCLCSCSAIGLMINVQNVVRQYIVSLI